MENLELECFHCGGKITLEMADEEYEHYDITGSLIEGSESYHNLFDGFYNSFLFVIFVNIIIVKFIKMTNILKEHKALNSINFIFLYAQMTEWLLH